MLRPLPVLAVLLGSAATLVLVVLILGHVTLACFMAAGLIVPAMTVARLARHA